ncbi:MAG: Carboxy-terminal processing protease CtpB precursor [Candidatus Izimaplasma bacterium HR2]|nr:MAG: Carboxy-terminal processing protease CtpB precursor [Candidatus Izimaplasma bacterium HR2]
MYKKIFIITLVFAMSLTLVGCKKEYVIETCEITGEVDFPENEIDYDLLSEVIYTIEGTHYTLPTRETLIKGAIEGVISSLDDPYSKYFNSEDFSDYETFFNESYIGLGISIETIDEVFVVREIIKGSPAELGGLLYNDVIVSINGVSVLDKSYSEMSDLLPVDVGEVVEFSVIRSGIENIHDVSVTVGIVFHPSVSYSVIERGNELIGYINVRKFGNLTATLFLDALNDLEDKGIDSLVIDLRGNPGGKLEATILMLRRLLVYSYDPMFRISSEAYGEVYNYFYFGTLTEPKDYDIVTLVNERSASASEIFASAMQEHGGYTILGVTTYGKGVGQNSTELIESEGDTLRLTTGTWYTAEGNWIHGIGVIPNIIQELNRYEEAYEVFLLNGEVIKYDTVGERVANIQVVLNLMGYTVRTDGYYDLATKEAVMEIQASHSLTVTGNLDRNSLDIINEALSDYQNNVDNDSQLQAAIDYLTGN